MIYMERSREDMEQSFSRMGRMVEILLICVFVVL